jgi:hypothetical protein
VSRPNDYIVIYVRPSLQGSDQPVTAFLGGTQLEGQGESVVEAVTDLFAITAVQMIARKLERQIAQALAGVIEDRRAR